MTRPAPPAPSTARLVECHYCGKFSRELMNHGPGRCRPPLFSNPTLFVDAENRADPGNGR